jgi:hypothetical protein
MILKLKDDSFQIEDVSKVHSTPNGHSVWIADGCHQLVVDPAEILLFEQFFYQRYISVEAILKLADAMREVQLVNHTSNVQ